MGKVIKGLASPIGDFQQDSKVYSQNGFEDRALSINTVRSVGAEYYYEAEKTKGSRFLAHVLPCETSELAKEQLEAIRKKYPDASHHCWAWQGASRDDYRYSDDGEPSGSAGKPIHNAIVGRTLVGVMVVVVRYFGGTKLGTGGLVRAYGGCAAEALDESPIVETVLKATLIFRCDYEKVGLMQAIVNATEHASVESQFQEAVVMTVQVPVGKEAEFQAEVQERSGGKIILLEN